MLRLALDEFSLSKFYILFGISKVKSAAVTAFRSSCRHPQEKYLGNERVAQPLPADRERLSLTSLEVIADSLLEIMEASMVDIPDCDWLQTWTSLARSFAFCYNPALQPRALIVFGCISKSVSDQDVRHLLRILIKALEQFNDIVLIEALVMCLTRIQPVLKPVSKNAKMICSLRFGRQTPSNVHLIVFCSISRNLPFIAPYFGLRSLCCSWTKLTCTQPDLLCWSKICIRWILKEYLTKR